MVIKQGFLILCIEEDKLFLIIDENTRVKYFTTSLNIYYSNNDCRQFKTGLTMLREANGKPATITKEELEQLIAKADNKQARHWSKPTPTNTYEKGAIYYYHYEWSFDE